MAVHIVLLRKHLHMLQNFEKYTHHIREFLILLNNAGVTLKLKKRQFLNETIDCLGHAICPKPLDISSHMTDAKRGLHGPTKITKLRFLSSLYNVFRRFALNVARLAVPLNKRLRKDQLPKFRPLIEEELTAMNDSNEALLSPPVPVIPDSTGRMTPATVVCDKQIG